jgi:putative molybdopterin biosynthesis protein
VVELLAQQMRTRYPDIALSLEFRGSLAGLMALAQGQADVAGAHLQSERGDEYNVEHVRHILPGLPVVLVTLARREVGLIVAAGNPKGIRGIEDVARPGVRLVNRQRGSGTRILLDARLRESGIAPQTVQGYDDEETTHLAVATAVAEGRADVGLGIRAAAESLGLDFLPLLRERYDLVIPARFRDARPIQRLLDILTSPSFRDVVTTLGGYDLSETGRETLLE